MAGSIEHCKWHRLWRSTLTLPRRSLPSECHTVSRCCCNIYALRHSTVFPWPICTKLTNSQPHFVQICCTELHRNVQGTDRNFCIALTKVSLALSSVGFCDTCHHLIHCCGHTLYRTANRSTKNMENSVLL